MKAPSIVLHLAQYIEGERKEGIVLIAVRFESVCIVSKINREFHIGIVQLKNELSL